MNEEMNCPYCGLSHPESTALCPNLFSVTYRNGGAATFDKEKMVEFLTHEQVDETIKQLRADVERLNRDIEMNLEHDVERAIAERKAIGREIFNLLDPYDSNGHWVRLRDRITAGEFGKGEVKK